MIRPSCAKTLKQARGALGCPERSEDTTDYHKSIRCDAPSNLTYTSWGHRPMGPQTTRGWLTQAQSRATTTTGGRVGENCTPFASAAKLRAVRVSVTAPRKETRIKAAKHVPHISRHNKYEMLNFTLHVCNEHISRHNKYEMRNFSFHVCNEHTSLSGT